MRRNENEAKVDQYRFCEFIFFTQTNIPSSQTSQLSVAIDFLLIEKKIKKYNDEKKYSKWNCGNNVLLNVEGDGTEFRIENFFQKPD